MAMLSPSSLAWAVLPLAILWLIWRVNRDKDKKSATSRHEKEECVIASVSADPLVSKAMLLELSKNLSKQWKRLGRQMGLEEGTLDAIEEDNHSDLQEKVYKMLTTWKHETGKNATESALIQHLHAIKRVDLAERISCSSLLKTTDEMKQHLPYEPRQSADKPCTLQQLKERLQDEYRRFLLKGLPWMHEIKMSLEQYYVDLTLIQEDERGVTRPVTTLQLTQIFDAARNKKLSKILVEGDPGYGKTTLTLKLCFDYASDEPYIHHFDLVLWFPLRNFEGSLDDMLLAAAKAQENASSALKIIKEESHNILLILDGLDELPPKHEKAFMSLFQDQCFSFLTILVTSRTGKVAPNLGEQLLDQRRISCDMSISTKHVWDERFKIVGIDEGKQQEFVDQHLSKFPVEERHKVLSSLAQMRVKGLLTSDFLTCPLFLLMIVLILSGTETFAVQNVTTRTELYKNITNFLIRRYLAKKGHLNASTANLFLGNKTETVSYVDMFNKFGQLALEALQADKYYFSQETIDMHYETGESISDVGILTQTVSVTGFIEKLYYEPIHKSFLEFGAAYFLYNQLAVAPRSHWEKTICSLRPNTASAGSSLLFPFLAGLLGKDVDALFHAIKPYASEYSSWFGTLVYSLMEVEIKPSVFQSIMPLLPLHWVAKWSMNDQAFSSSSQHEAILRLGLQNRKIRQIEWGLNYAVRFPDQLEVQTLILYIGDDLAQLSNRQYKNFRCNDLHCCFVGRNPSMNAWRTFRFLLSIIQFDVISFHLMTPAFFFLPLIHTAVTSEELMKAKIRWLYCEISENKSQAQLMKNLTQLVERERIRSLFIVVQQIPSSNSLPNEQGQDLEHNSLLQRHVDNLVSCASHSARLTCFILKNYEPRVPLTVNLAQLCAEGGKMWKWIELNKVTLQCNFNSQNSKCQIRFLHIHHSFLTDSVYNLLQSCHVTSLRCLWSQLSGYNYSVLPACITQLIVVLDECFHGELSSCLSELHNLQFLFLQMKTFQYNPTSYPADKWLFGSHNNLLSVKGLEIWDVESNFSLSCELVKAVIGNLVGRPVNQPLPASDKCFTSSLPQTKKLELQYLMISTLVEPDVNNPSESDCAKIDHFLYLLSQLKQTLIEHFLRRLDVVFYDKSFIDYMSKFKPNGHSSLLEVFSPDEGFRIEHDFWGMREDDSYHSRKLHELTPTVFKRFSISFHKVR